MNFHIMTLFPEMVMGGLSESITGRAMEKQLINIEAVNIRDFAGNRYGHVDDYTYGGGAGMLMQAKPVYDAYMSIKDNIGSKPRVLYMTPQGTRFNQDMAMELSKEDDLVLLCGHYEGIDQRVIDEIVDMELSVGDFVLTGGEIPAMAVVDTVSRLIPGVLAAEESYENESHYNGLLEYPQYTRPPVWHRKEIPEILVSGHHANIEKWKHEQALLNTLKKRPDMLKKAELTKADEEFLKKYSDGE